MKKESTSEQFKIVMIVYFTCCEMVLYGFLIVEIIHQTFAMSGLTARVKLSIDRRSKSSLESVSVSLFCSSISLQIFLLFTVLASNNTRASNNGQGENPLHHNFTDVRTNRLTDYYEPPELVQTSEDVSRSQTIN